jgi:ABC-type lipoprotein export system ATPase subunit
MNAPVVVSRGLRRDFVEPGGAVVGAVAEVSLTVARGELVAIVGSSGSGKTTLLNLIGGLDRPTGGNVNVAGLALEGLSEKQLTAFRRDHVGFVFQAYHLVPTMSVVENIALTSIVRGLPRSVWAARAEEVMGSLRIVDLRDRPESALSGGQRQRVAIGRALFARPGVLLADEPTGALDSESSRSILSLIRKAVDSGDAACGLLVTHDLAAAAYADRVLLMQDGAIRGELGLDHTEPAGDRAEREEPDHASRIRDWMAAASR